MYPPTRKGAPWWELDDPSERIEGTRKEDYNSPYDSDVVDAPEDIRRVKNDHHPLHNAKLSPTGYYNGFHAKDYKGNYAQMSQKRRPHHHHRQFVQIADHNKDTDDLVEDENFVHIKDHNKDTDDLVEDENFAQLKDHDNDSDDILENENYVQLNDHENDTDDLVEKENFVQLRQTGQYEHENDTEDIDMDSNPSDFRARGSAR